MDRSSRSPLPWEEKGAVGCLLLLSLQELHEILTLFLPQSSLGLASLQLFAPLLMMLFLGFAHALVNRFPKAWHWTVYSMIGFALLHVALFWGPVRNSVDLDRRIATILEYEWIKGPGLRPFELFWVIARHSFLTVCPALLFLGKLRQSLKQS